MRKFAIALMLGVAACAHAPEAEETTEAVVEAATAAVEEAQGAVTEAKEAVVAANIAAAVADPARPDADKEADARRKPAAMLTFAGIEPGMKVGDMISGGGYFTRLFSKAVGAEGKVYGLNGPAREGRPAPLADIVADTENYANVSNVEVDFANIEAPEPLDVIWTSQNYHDIRNRAGAEGMLAVNASVMAALKPGGVFIVLDHSAAVDAAEDPGDSLHRIQMSVVLEDLAAAGFEVVGTDDSLRNPADPRDKTVFDPAFRGVTDQFVIKARKPAQ